MKTLTDIPWSLDADCIMTQLRIEPGSDDAAELQSLIEQARAIGRPKAAYAPCFVTGRDGADIEIEHVRFTSRALARNLADVERVFAFVTTCGHELDLAAPAGDDPLQAFWWDAVKSHLLGAAGRYLNEHLQGVFRLGKTASMHPGAADASVWPIEQQKELFLLLPGVEQALDVRLTESCLMIPNKTVSGVLFPSQKDFRSCEVCRREGCPSRRAPFNAELWETIRHD